MVSRPEIQIGANDLLTEAQASEAAAALKSGGNGAIEPSRERLSGKWEHRQGNKLLTLRFLERGSGEGPLTPSRDGSARLDFEGFEVGVGSATSDVVFDGGGKQVVFYPPGGVDQNGLPTAGPLGRPEQAPKPWGTATLIDDSLLHVKARIVGHHDWVLDATFVRKPTD
jgi:hypothetical protein